MGSWGFIHNLRRFNGEYAFAVAQPDVVVLEEALLTEEPEAGAVHAFGESDFCSESKSITEIDRQRVVVGEVGGIPDPAG